MTRARDLSALIGRNGEMKPGTIAYFGMATAPDGWLACDGALVSRTEYADLFAEISTDHGAGDGSTTFNLPDLRGEFIRGLDGGRGVDAGRALGTAQSQDVQSHTHPYTYVSATTGAGAGGADTHIRTYDAGGLNAATGPNAGAAETRPRNVALLACIKT
jgi:microcystin-dependent protein